ncbi:MAG: glycosyltransferase [Actinomycetes bacterium]
MIFVTLGTDKHPFDRAVEAVLSLPGDEDLVIQAGTSRVPSRLGERVTWHEFLSHDEAEQLMRRARLVICHAGVGSVISALSLGHLPIVMARSAQLNEAVDDHQIQIAQRMDSSGLVVNFDFETSLGEVVTQAGRRDQSALGEGFSELALALREAVETEADPQRWSRRDAAEPPDGETRVLICGPGSQRPGGMESFTRELLKSPPLGVSITEVDTYGDTLAEQLVRLGAACLKIATMRRSEIDVIHLNVAFRGSVVRKGLLAMVARSRGIPYVAHIHGGRFAQFHEELPKVARRAVDWFLRGAASVVVLGSRTQEYMLTGAGLPRERVTVIRNGVSPSSHGDSRVNLAESEKEGGASSPVRIAFVGREIAIKGLDDLLEALSRLRVESQWTLSVAGQGESDSLRRRLDDLGLGDRVTLLGWVNHDAVARMLEESDIYVLPSHIEGLPIALLEAMSAKCAVIATRVGEVPEVVEHGRDGYLVPPRDPGRLSEALGTLIEDGAHRRQMAGAAYRKFAQLFTHEVMAASLQELWAATSEPHRAT